jgi:protein-tyrosine phosphatase
VSRDDGPHKPAAARLRSLVKAALAHPFAVKLREPLRNARWALVGRRTGNPPVPPGVNTMLFVCLGNICRSPFGARLAERVLAESGRGGIRCVSAGVRPSQDNRSPDEACEVATAYGVTLTDHRPQALTRELMDASDLVVVMEWRQLTQVRETYPEHRDRIFLLPLFDDQARNAYERYNITDPFGRPRAAFEECYLRVDRSLRRFLASVQP